MEADSIRADSDSDKVQISSSVKADAEDARKETRWIVTYASIGDCKIFLWEKGTEKICDIGQRVRINKEAKGRDCGGRLGPTDAKGSPDMRNFFVTNR